MTKILSADLASTFLVDGSHFAQGMIERLEMGKALCEQLILHEKMLVPVEDFAALIPLCDFLGVEQICHLIEDGRISFVRTLGTMSYTGTDQDGSLITFDSPAGRVAAHAPLDQCVDTSLQRLNVDPAARTRLANAAKSATTEVRAQAIVDSIRAETYAQFKASQMWRPQYETADPALLKLPVGKDMKVHIYGPKEIPSRSPVNTLLALARSNFELKLATDAGVNAMSTSCPIADAAALNIQAHRSRAQGLDHLLVSVGVPDISVIASGGRAASEKFVELTGGRDAKNFRQWFHGQGEIEPNDFTSRYIDLLHKAGPLDSAPGKYIRFAIFKLIGALFPPIGLAADAADSFLLPKLVEGTSPKFFISRVRNFAGAVKR